MNEDSSCWIHVSQPWGGTGYGGVNLPRIGQEVLVDFLDGDPDRPVIVGRVYTNLQKVPYPLPAHKTQSGWRSNSTNATGGYNEVMFEDSAGQELVRMQAEKDLHKLVKNDEEHTVGHDRTRRVHHDESVTVGNDRTRQVMQTERVSIGMNQSVMVGVNRSTQIGNIDSTIVGHTHVVMVSPPGEGGVPQHCTSTVHTPTKQVIKTAGGANITLDGDHITMTSADLTIKSKSVAITNADRFSVEADDIVISGKRVSIIGHATAHYAGRETHLDGVVVYINGPGQPAARMDDPVGGQILAGSTTVFIGGTDQTVITGLGVDVDLGIASNPELSRRLQALRDKGWTYEKSDDPNCATHVLDTDQEKKIYVGPQDQGSPRDIVRALDRVSEPYGPPAPEAPPGQ
jgi:type VI secretion system secreted protein VgrG